MHVPRCCQLRYGALDECGIPSLSPSVLPLAVLRFRSPVDGTIAPERNDGIPGLSVEHEPRGRLP
jgi:hypothetical protein